MDCINHKNVEAVFKCQDCQNSICNDCAVNNNGQITCIKCAKEKGLLVIKNEKAHRESYKAIDNQYNKNNRISTFLTTILSFIPGLGHMYLGFMRRGLQIMLAFFGVIAVSNVIYNLVPISTALATVIWFFSVFECFHLRRRLQAGEEVVEELFVNPINKEMNLYYVGIGLLVFGGLLLIDVGINNMLDIFGISKVNVLYEIIKIARGLILPVLLIIGGIWLLKRHKKNAKA